jgi:hypothetical protein
MCTGTHDFIPAAETAKLVAYWDVPGGKALNVTYWQVAGGWNEASLGALITFYSNNWDTQMSPLQANTIDCNRIVATDVSAEDSFEVDTAPPDDLIGGRASAIMPGNVTVVTKFGTGLAGRSFRGRSYHIGLTEDMCLGDALTAGNADALRDAWQDLVGAIHDSALAASLVVVSYCHAGAWRDEAVVTPVSSFTTENILDSQRRRLAGRGM